MRSSRRTKIALITDDTVVVDIDVAKVNHMARCTDHRGVTLCEPFRFHNTSDGLESLTRNIDRVRQDHGLNRVVVAMEPTGHCWKAIAYRMKQNRLESKMAELIATTPYGDALMSIPALGVVTVATLLSETGDLSNYASWRQLQKLAGLNMTENSSGKHKGRCRISKRGRSALRSLLYQSALRMIIHSSEFKALHGYFTKRTERPLAGKQSVVALSLKLLRIIFYIARQNDRYDASKVLGEYRKEQLAAA